MNLVLFGPPGVGKGTQAARLSEKYSLHVLSTGNILRDEVAKGSDLGKKVKDVMDQGKFSSDDLIMRVLTSAMESTSKSQSLNKGFIFDGVPRTLFQAEELQDILEKRDEAIDAVIVLDVKEEALVERLKSRYTCVKCGEVYNDTYRNPKTVGICDMCGSKEFMRRSDDEEETIRMRLKVYHDKTVPVLSFYKEKGIVHEVDGMQDPDQVQASIESILSKIVGKA